jgi:hypothetical protein
MTTITTKSLRFLHRLHAIANKSSVSHQHAAVLVYNGNPVAWDFNSIKGKHTHHAEFSVIRKFLISRGNLGFVKKSSILWNEQYYEKCS